MRNQLLALMIAIAPLAAAAEHTAYKLYADTYETEAQVREVLKAPELAIVQQDQSGVTCKENALFGVLYILQKADARRASLTERWHHPHIRILDKTYTDRSVDLRFGQAFSEPMFSGYELLPSIQIDGEFRLEVLEDGKPILEHTFTVDCPNSEPGDALVCEEEVNVGTRIKKLACLTRDQYRQRQEDAGRNIRRSDGD